MQSEQRELLELAARAARIQGSYFHSDNPIHCGIYQARGEYYWNPLISDSEALRLAVKLRMDIETHELTDGAFRRVTVLFAVGPNHDWDGIEQDNEFCDSLDDAGMVRRAIVRAAAEIGRAAQGEG